MQKTELITERAGTKTTRTILAQIDQIHKLETQTRTTKIIRKYLKDAYINAWITEAEELEDLFGDELLKSFLIRFHNIQKYGADERLKRQSNKFVTRKITQRIQSDFLLYEKQKNDISNARLPKNEKKKLYDWRLGRHGESGLGYRLSSLIRTEANRAVNEASIDVYQEAGIEWYMCCEILDDRTCEFCHEIDGQIFKVSEAVVGVNLSPFHPNCRGYTIPFI